MLLHVALCHLYTIITSVHSFVRAAKCKNVIKATEYRILGMFLFFPLSLGIIQILIPSIPSVGVGLTLVFLFVYLDVNRFKKINDSKRICGFLKDF